MTGSIRQRLMLLVLASVSVVWVAALVSSYRQAVHEAGEWDDARIEQAARTLTLVDTNDLAALIEDGFHTSDDDGDDDLSRRLLYEVHDAEGRLLAASPGLPRAAAKEPPSSQEAAGAVAKYDALKWNTYVLHDAAHGRSVQVFERRDSRADLGAGVARRIAKPLAYALPVLALLIWVGIGSSLAPLKTLSRAIGVRNADNLELIDMRRTPAEVRPWSMRSTFCSRGCEGHSTVSGPSRPMLHTNSNRHWRRSRFRHRSPLPRGIRQNNASRCSGSLKVSIGTHIWRINFCCWRDLTKVYPHQLRPWNSMPLPANASLFTKQMRRPKGSA